MIKNEMPSFHKVLRYIKRWGVKAEESGAFARQVDDSKIAWAPASDHGIHWATRTIYWQPPFTQEAAKAACALLHELSHVLVQYRPIQIDEETSALLAMDYYSVRYLRIGGWGAWMGSFNFDHEIPRKGGFTHRWKEVSVQMRHKTIQKSLKEAVRLGLLDANGRPTFQRRPGL